MGKFFQKQLFSSPIEVPDLEGEYENCTFENVNFSHLEFSGAEFFRCHFAHCDLSMAVLEDVVLREATFESCKLLGIDFGKCSRLQFSAAFTECQMNYVQFVRGILKKTRFIDCSLRESSFQECDLTWAVFDGCDLERASFEQCNLENADFRAAHGYSIDPNINRMRNAQFALPGVLGLLGHLGIQIE